MTRSKLLLPAVTALLYIAPSGAAAQDPPTIEKKVIVWRSEDGQETRLETVGSHRGFLGVGLLDLTAELRQHFGVPTDRGVMVSRVTDGSPAARAGLAAADILTGIDNRPLPSALDLSMRVAGATEGSEVEIEYWRQGRKAAVRVPVELRVRPQVDIAPMIHRRIKIRAAGEVETTDHVVDIDSQWIEEVVHSVGESFGEANFLEQLEALRRERADLLGQLTLMESRLAELERELGELKDD